MDTGGFGDWSFWLGTFLGVVWLDPVSQRRCGSRKSPCNFRSGRVVFYRCISLYCIYRGVTPCKMDQVSPKHTLVLFLRTRLFFFSFSPEGLFYLLHIHSNRAFHSLTHPHKTPLPLSPYIHLNNYLTLPSPYTCLLFHPYPISPPTSPPPYHFSP